MLHVRSRSARSSQTAFSRPSPWPRHHNHLKLQGERLLQKRVEVSSCGSSVFCADGFTRGAKRIPPAPLQRASLDPPRRREQPNLASLLPSAPLRLGNDRRRARSLLMDLEARGGRDGYGPSRRPGRLDGGATSRPRAPCQASEITHCFLK